MGERASLEKLIGAVLGNYRLERLIEQNKWGPAFLASTRTGANFVVRFIGLENARSEQSSDAQNAHIVFLGRFQ
ncbi:MAG TPA: hypothetical protein VGU68_01980, partial [Ktedonobacteraceae bacterium]|nr:hypothetical protein [Ktedonobacteraceae bacterium]